MVFVTLSYRTQCNTVVISRLIIRSSELAFKVGVECVVAEAFEIAFSDTTFSAVWLAEPRTHWPTQSCHNYVSSINADSKYTGVCRRRLLSTWWTTTRVHRTSQAANALDRSTVTSWWFHDRSMVVGLSWLRVRWNGTRFHTHSGSLLEVPTASNRRWKLIFSLRNRDE